MRGVRAGRSFESIVYTLSRTFTAHSGPRSGPLAVATAGALAPRSHLGRLGATARARRRGELEQYEPESSGTHDAFDCAELVFPLDLELEKQYPGLPAYIAVP